MSSRTYQPRSSPKGETWASADAGKSLRTAEPVENVLIRIALTYVGVPYRWGGLTPAGFDCSGFVTYLHARVGISIPHNVAAQYRYGMPVTKDQLRPGDLVFFDRLHHNGIYIGRGQFIHASRTGDGVKISSLDDPWYKSRWIGGRRLAGET
jgi:cell wall-associated NlpC family hydrolase